MSLRERLTSLGLADLEASIAAAARPCVYLVLGEPDDAHNALSRVGGDPSLPPGEPWPCDRSGRAMTFVLQIDLARVALREFSALPANASLALFVGSLDGGNDLEHRFVVVPRETAARRTTPRDVDFADDTFAAVPPYALELHEGLDYPRWATRDERDLTHALSDEQGDAYREDFIRSMEPPGPIVGKLLGHVAGIGEDPRPYAHVARDGTRAVVRDFYGDAADFSGPRHWQNLLTIDSCPKLNGLCIADAGYLLFMIRDADLARGELGSVYEKLESS